MSGTAKQSPQSYNWPIIYIINNKIMVILISNNKSNRKKKKKKERIIRKIQTMIRYNLDAPVISLICNDLWMQE